MTARGAAASGRDLRAGGTWTGPQRFKNGLLHALARATLAVASVLPRRVLDASCRLLGWLVHACSPRLRALVRSRLERGSGSAADARAVRRVFASAGALLADTVALLDPDEPVGRTMALPETSRRVLQAAFDGGRGVVFATAHLGSWERMAALLAAEGFPVATVARESYDPRFTALYERLRAPRGVRCIWRGRSGAGKQVVRELRAGRAVGFLIDLPGRSPAMLCPLFGSESPVATGPARLAIGLGAAVVLGTPVPRDDRRAEVLIERIASGEAGASPVAELTLRLAGALSARIARSPEAWMGLFHGLGGSE